MDSRLQLRQWNLPQCVLQRYTDNGLTCMFQWQAECLSIDGVLDGRNLVYAAPTSAGKTLVVEILLLKRVLETGKKAIFVLPFVSVAREKLFHMKSLFEEAGIRVDGYMGGHAPTNGFSSVDVAICTIEKANGLINRLIEEKTIDQIGMLVVDELHMVGDEGRGYILELLLTKIRFMEKSKSSATQTTMKNAIQIVGMSATLPNLDLLSDWLDAALYVTDFRPVPLQRCLKIGSAIYDDSVTKIRDFAPAFISKKDEDNVASLCYETLSEGNSVLVFCPTKNWCEKLADNIAHQFYDLNIEHQKNRSKPHVKLNMDNIKDIFEQLCRCPVGVDAILNRTMPLGVAYHHAGLTTEERDIVESGFRSGAIRVLAATSTLSSGVNLPARRVIIRTPVFNRKTLDVRTYLQMTGRAGRKGVDDEGESILICRQNEQSRGKTLITSKPLPIKSCLIQAADEELTTSMKRAILEIIVNGIASTYEAVEAYTNCTLLSAQIKNQKPQVVTGPMTRRRSSSSPVVKKAKAFNQNVIESCINWLVDHEFVLMQQNENNVNGTPKEAERLLVATQLGRAALLSSLPTSDALTVLADLHQAKKALALDTELHLIYLVTPIFCYNEWTGLDWYKYLNVYESLSNPHKNAATLIGVNEQFLTRIAAGASMGANRGRQSEKMQRLLGTHRRFYAALALHDLVQEVPLPKVCEKYSCNRGMLQQLQQSAASFAGMVTTFCQELGWWSLEVLLREFQTRLAFGVQRELMDLMQISLLNSQRARALYAAGLTSCQLVANVKPADIELVLRNSTHFQTARKAANECEWEAEERKKQRCIFITGKKGLTEYEAAALVIEEARKISGISQDTTKGEDEIEVLHSASQQHSQDDSNTVNSAKSGLDNGQSDEMNKLPSQHDIDTADAKLFSEAREHHVSAPEVENDSIAKIENLAGSTNTNQTTSEIMGKGISNDTGPDSGCISKESSVTETQLKLILDGDDSMEQSASGEKEMKTDLICINNDVQDQHNFTSSSNCRATSRDPQETSGHLMLSVSSASDGGSLRESLFDNSSGVESPITLVLDGSSDDDLPMTSMAFEHSVPISSAAHTSYPKESSKPVSDVKLHMANVNPPVIASKTSLTDSQLNAMLDDSFSQDLSGVKCTRSCATPETKTMTIRQDESIYTRDMKAQKPHTMTEVSSPMLSPGTLKAMDISFSPCVPKPNCNPSESNLGIDDKEKKILLRHKPILAPDRASTPKYTNWNKVPKKFHPAEQPLHFSLVQQCKNSGEINLNNQQASPRVDSAESSAEDLFGASPDKRISSGSISQNTGSFKSVGELDCALNVSASSSDFDDRDIPANFDENKHCDKLRSHGSPLKRKSPNLEISEKVKKQRQRVGCTDDKPVLKTPVKSSSPDEAELILSSQKAAKRRLTKNTGIHTSASTPPTIPLKSRKSIFKTQIRDAGLKDQTNTPSRGTSMCSPQSATYTQAESQQMTASQSGLTIIDVCSHQQLFDTFLREWATKKHFAIAVAARASEEQAKSKISMPETHEAVLQRSERNPYEGTEPPYVVSGIAVCWGQHDAYYISLEKARELIPEEGKYEDEFLCLKPPSLAPDINTEKHISSIKSIAGETRKKNCTMSCFDMKKQVNVLSTCTGILFDGSWQDPGVASWMLDPSANEKTLIHMVNHFIPEDIHLISGLNKCSNYGSICCGLRCDVQAPARIRACVEAVCTYRLMKSLKQELIAVKMWDMFTKIEMPHVKSLATLELNGIGFDTEACSTQITKLHEMMRQLEKQAHRLAHKRFSLASPNEVAQVLYGDLCLPPDGIKQSGSLDVRRTALGVGKSASWRKGSRKGKIPQSWSTKKEVLEKLMHLHPLPAIILNWRQLSFTLSKTVHPFSRVHKMCGELQMRRVHCHCITQSITGRVSVAEPNIQNVPKLYEVKIPSNTEKVDEDCVHDINARSLFVPAAGNVFLAADYSQLELRIFAHLSGDKKLLNILNSDAGDVFKMIAAQWKGVMTDAVSDVERQRAKQICYGMLYGIGPKALSQQLNVDEKDAEQFMESFMRSYPGVRTYIRYIVQKCTEKGYIETLCGRRRYLPGIKDSNMMIRSQAERQAVNSTVQGSAADLVKKATVKLQRQLEKKWSVLLTRRQGRGPGCYFVLHLHDELMFEVDRRILPLVSTDVRDCLEQATKLKVKLPVKLRSGKSWGHLEDYNTD